MTDSRDLKDKPLAVSEMVKVKDVKKIDIQENEVHVEVEEGSPNKSLKNVSKVDLTVDHDKPDYKQFVKRIDELHARNEQLKPYTFGEIFCRVKTGWHTLCSTTRKSDIDKFGVGIVHYFRFVKYLAIFALIATILAVPSLYFAIKSGEDTPSDYNDFKTALFLTTLGSIAKGSSQCVKAQVPTSDLIIEDQNQATFSCEKGTIGKFSTLEYGRITETESLTCDLYTEHSWDTTCNFETPTDLTTVYQSECEGQKNCTLDLQSYFFNFAPSSCAEWGSTTAEDQRKYFYIKILCQNIELSLPDGKLISKFKVGWIIASLDAVISALYILFLILLKRYEKKTVEYVLGNLDSVERCSVEVKNLPGGMTVNQLRGKLWNHFSSIKIGDKIQHINVVDVQVAESQRLLTLNSQLGVLKEKKVSRYQKYYSKWADKESQNANEIQYDELQKISVSKGKKAKSEFKKIQKMKQSQDYLQHKIHKNKNIKKTQVKSAFVTFETKEERDAVFYHHQRSPFTRLGYSLCCCGYKNDPNVFEKKYLNVTDAPDPTNIRWQNMHVGNVQKYLRRLLSWVITIGLWIISFICMAYVRNEQKVLAAKVKPYKDCSAYPSGSLTEERVNEDVALGAGALGLIECYCRDISKSFTDICESWTIDRILSHSLPYLIVFAIIIINYFVQIIFILLSTFEKHRSKSSETVSRILKIFVGQALNTGIIILIVNAKFANRPIPNVLDGTFDDVTPQWYLDVATTILLTMIINIASLPVINIINSLVTGLARCCDRGCSSDPTKTKKKSQKAWVELYTGPKFLIELRYARILTVIFVCMLYSADIPLLYASTLLNLIIIYWTDKIELLRICQIPKNLDRKMQSIVRQLLFLAVFLHLGKAIWAYGYPEIFGDSDSIQVASDILESLTKNKAPGVFARFLERAIQQQNISLTIIFLLALFLLILRIFFLGTLNQIVRCCSRRQTQKRKESHKHNESEYFGRIKRFDLELERKYLENEIFMNDDENLKQKLHFRLDRVNAELLTRTNLNEPVDDKFIGVFSYSIGHHPTYKKYYDTKGFVIGNSPNQA